MHRNQVLIFIIMVLLFLTSPSLIAAERQPLTLEQALSLALGRNPDLSASLAEIQAREANIIQARSFQNPEVELKTENIYGTKDRTGFDSAESSLSIGQTIELAGKRSKRTTLATLDRDLAQWDMDSKTLDVILEVTRSFIDILTEQKRVRLQEELDYRPEPLCTCIGRVHCPFRHCPCKWHGPRNVPQPASPRRCSHGKNLYPGRLFAIASGAYDGPRGDAWACSDGPFKRHGE